MFSDQRRTQTKKGCFGCSKKGHFVEDCPSKLTAKTKKKSCKPKPSQQSTLGMILQVKKKSSTTEVAASIHHQALHTCALWHEVTLKAQALVRVTVMMKNLLMKNLKKPSCFSKKFALSKRNN
jgi:hypothetical protein